MRKKIFNKVKNITKEIFYPKDLMSEPDAFTKEQLRALSDRRTISRSLFYRSYVQMKDKAGFYIQADGRVGIVFRLYPPPYLLGDTEKDIINLINSIVLDETVLNISTYASKDIHRIMDEYEKVHNINPNIKHPDILKEFSEDVKNNYYKWTTESISGNESDLRIRNFIHTLSILFPYDTDDFIINQQYNQILGMFKSYGIRPLAPDEFIPYVREILNPALKKYPLSNDEITTINKQIAKGAVIKLSDKENTLFLNDGWRAKVLTTDKYPREIDIFTFQNLFFSAMGDDFQINLPCPFLLSLTVKFKNVKKQKKLVLAKARWNLGQLSGMPPIVYKKRPHLKERRDENEEVIQYIENLGEIPLEAFLSLTIFEKDKNKLDQYTAMIKKSFEQTKGEWILKEERFPQIAYQTLLMSLPLQYSEIIHTNIDKFDKNFKSNNAQMAPLIGDFSGNGIPNHIYLGRTGQIMPLDIFNSDNYNIVVIGPMGSGKSIWANDFLAKALSAGWQIRMIDFGRSYQKFADTVGGEFLEFSPNSDVCMNFFTDILTKKEKEKDKTIEKIVDEEIELLVPIVGYMAGLNLQDIYKDINSSSSDKLNMTVLSVFISNAITRAFEIKGRDAGMREVREALIDFKNKAKEKDDNFIVSDLGKMIISLEPYSTPSGPYFKYFNGASNVKFKNNYFVMELDDISKSPIMPVVAMLYLQKTAREAFIEYLKDKSTRRVVGVDEAWKVLDNPLFAKFLEDFARRIRKYFGITLVISQSLDEFFQNSQAKIIYKTADWKIFLPHSKDAIDIAIKDENISLNEFEKKLFKSLNSRFPHYGEFFVKHKNRAFVALLKLSPYSYWLSTSNPADRAKIDTIMKRYNLSMQDSVRYLAKKDEGLSEDEIFDFISKRNKKKIDLNWDDFFREIISKKMIKIRKEPIVDKNLNIQFYENLPSLIYKNIELFPKDFMFKAKELNYIMQIKKIFFKEILNRSVESGIFNSVNISIEGMRNKNFSSYIYNLFKYSKQTVYLEIKLDYNEEEVKEAIAFANKFKNIKDKVKVIFDNVSFDNISLSSLINFSPAYIKINIDELKSKKDDTYFVNIIKVLEKEFNIKTVITYIEKEDDFELIKKLGINYMQGYYIMDRLELTHEKTIK